MPTKCPYCHCLGSIVRAGYSRPVHCLRGAKQQRLRCSECGRRFAKNFFAMGYRLKKSDPALNAKIFTLCVHGLSNRSIGRLNYVSTHCVRLRLVRLARQAIYFHHHIIQNLSIKEPIAFDGLENFAGSQYDPNNIQQAIGRDSLFIYDFNFACMNRKGRMSLWQKRRLSEIESESGRYNPRAIREATVDILKRLYEKRECNGNFVILSDEHFQYRRAIKEDLAKYEIDHVTISSKACRNFQNILFSVNHADLVIRKQVGAFARETISFSKTAGAMCQKYALFVIYKNYLVPQFTKKHLRRPFAHLQTPAQQIGIVDQLFKFSDIFHRRSLNEDTEALNEDWRAFWHGNVPVKFHRNHRYVKNVA